MFNKEEAPLPQSLITKKNFFTVCARGYTILAKKIIEADKSLINATNKWVCNQS